jgi:hypothetical protein
LQFSNILHALFLSVPFWFSHPNTVLCEFSLFVTGQEPLVPPSCEHCPPGYQCNPVSGACIKGRMSFGSSTITILLVK